MKLSLFIMVNMHFFLTLHLTNFLYIIFFKIDQAFICHSLKNTDLGKYSREYQNTRMIMLLISLNSFFINKKLKKIPCLDCQNSKFKL